MKHTSNCPHEFALVVQAQCTGMGWADSRYGGHTPKEALAAEATLLSDNAAWMPGPRKTRIVPRRAH